MISVIPMLRSAVSVVSGKDPQGTGSTPKEQRSSSNDAVADDCRKETLSPKFLKYAKTVLSLAAYMIASSVLIFINKRILVEDAFHFPFALTCIEQYFSALAVVLLIATGMVKVRSPPSFAEVRDKILPVGICSAVTMFTGNYAYIYLSVAFIQILKAFTPAFTLALLVAMGSEPLAPYVVAAVLMIAVGTGGSVLIESSTPAFHLLGFLSFVMSSCSEAGRVVLFQVSMGKMRFNVFESLVYLSPVTGTILLILSLAMEWEGMIAPGGGFDKVLAKPGLYLTATVMSFLVNLFTYLAIMSSSGLTFKVVGCVKNAALVILGVMFMGEHVTLAQGAGYAVSIGGFLMYTHVKMNRGNAAAGPQPPSVPAKEKERTD